MGSDTANAEHGRRWDEEFCGSGADVLGKLGQDCERVGMLCDLWVESSCACCVAGSVWVLSK